MHDEASGKAIASLVFGILSWFMCPCAFGVVAIVLGAGERSGIGRAGFWLGVVNVVLMTLGIFLYLFVLGGLAALGVAGEAMSH